MVFFLLIVVIVFASFAVVLNQNISLEATMIQSRQMDLDKANELLVLKSVNSDGYFRINNSCPLSAQVVRLWVQDANGNSWSQPVPSSNQLILPNDERWFGPVAGAANQYRYWFITARGNQFTYLIQGGPGQDGIDGKDGSDGIAQVANGVGYLAFDFESITYFTVSGGKLTPYPSGTQSYTMPVPGNAVPNIAIGFNVTFMNDNYDYIIDGKSHLWSYFAGVPGHTTGPVWFIVSNSSATIDASYKPVKLLFNQTQFIIYYNPVNKIDTIQENFGVAAINLIFFGTLTNRITGDPIKEYGQNVPFVSIKFT